MIVLTPIPTPLPARRERSIQSPIGVRDASIKHPRMPASLKPGSTPAPTLGRHPELVEGSRSPTARFAVSTTMLRHATPAFPCHPEPGGEASRPSLLPFHRRLQVSSRACREISASPTARCQRCRERLVDTLSSRSARRDPSTSLGMTRETCTMAVRNEILRQAQDDTVRGALIITAATPNRASLALRTARGAGGEGSSPVLNALVAMPPLSRASTSGEGLGVRALPGLGVRA